LDLETEAVAASWAVVDYRLARWQSGSTVVRGVAQVESRHWAKLYLLGLLSGVERKNS
jgi:hypothetical protein